MVDDCYSQTEVTMVDHACQTDMPHTSNSPQKIKSISLADLCQAVSNDHNYASSEDSFPNEDVICQPKQSIRKLGFSEIAVSYKEEQSEDEWLMEMSDSDKSELSDIDSDFGEENSDPEDLTLKTKGSLATIENLGWCEKPLQWQMQPFVSSMAAGNLLLSAGILFTGNSYGSVASLVKATNIQFFSERSYNETQTSYLFPIVDKMYTEHQVQTLSEVRNKEVVAGGDGRCDSPGHSSKYGTFSVEVENSNKMELQGLKRCSDHLQEENVTIAKLATDRHIQVRAHLKRNDQTSSITLMFGTWLTW